MSEHLSEWRKREQERKGGGKESTNVAASNTCRPFEHAERSTDFTDVFFCFYWRRDTYRRGFCAQYSG